MPRKHWIAEYDGHAIRVTNTWLGGAKLYIDGECRDLSNDKFALSAGRPVLSARLIDGDTESPLVKVYAKAIFTVRMRICVNGKQVAGDLPAA